ncbi:MAG: hypothetical protein QOD92_1150 [Acidimicrobiaceae bacterium]
MTKRHIVALLAVMVVFVAVTVVTIVWITSGDSRPVVPPDCTHGAQRDFSVRSDDSGPFYDC